MTCVKHDDKTWNHTIRWARPTAPPCKRHSSGFPRELRTSVVARVAGGSCSNVMTCFPKLGSDALCSASIEFPAGNASLNPGDVVTHPYLTNGWEVDVGKDDQNGSWAKAQLQPRAGQLRLAHLRSTVETLKIKVCYDKTRQNKMHHISDEPTFTTHLQTKNTCWGRDTGLNVVPLSEASKNLVDKELWKHFYAIFVWFAIYTR